MIRTAYAHQAMGQPDGGRPIGLDVTVRGLLRAWLRFAPPPPPRLCCAAQPEDFTEFAAAAAAEGIERSECAGLSLEQIACGAADGVFVPDPAIAARAWVRRLPHSQPFTLCGIAHGVSGEAAAVALGDCVLAPTTDHDAIICPSHAVRAAIEEIWRGYEDYAERRTGTRFRCPVQLPVIPLGIDCDHFGRMADRALGRAYRDHLGAGDGDVVIMFVGRISYVSKAHPLPLLLAAEETARHSGRRLHLVFHGYFHPSSAESDFRALAATVAPSVPCHFVMEADPRFTGRMWAAADIFVSLADNIQESFGLTPVEAMAAGLPVIVSDWDGYRDSVRDGIDGYCIPTLAPAAGSGGMLAALYQQGDMLYGTHLAAAAQSTAVSVPALAEALGRLVADVGLRARLGESGRRRAAREFDWRVIIPRYAALWEELAARRSHGTAYETGHPRFPDPFTAFRSYPSQHLSPATRVVAHVGEDALAKLFANRMNLFVPDTLLPPEQALALLLTVDRHPGASLGDLAAALEADADAVLRTIGWLVKLDLCRVAG